MRALALGGGVALLVLALAGGGFALTRLAHATPATTTHLDVSDCSSYYGSGGTSATPATGSLALAVNALATAGTYQIDVTCANASTSTILLDTNGGGPGKPVIIPAGDTVTFDASGLTLSGGSDNPTLTTFSGDNIQVLGVESNATLTLDDATITHGAGRDAGLGGGIVSEGKLTITNSTIDNNVAGSATNGYGGAGGGVLNLGGTLSITNSTIELNIATVNSGGDGYGGGVATIDGTTTITNSTIDYDIATTSSGGQGGGGGVANIDSGTGSTTTITNSSFAYNIASFGSGGEGAGGGVANAGVMTITNSTFAYNTASSGSNGTGIGGALENADTLTTTNSTFAGNIASSGSGGKDYGDGISNADNGTVAIGGSILTALTAAQSINCYTVTGASGKITSLGYNIEIADTCGFSATGDQHTIDPLLATTGGGATTSYDLASNGGPTETIALLDGSPAVAHIPAGGNFQVGGVDYKDPVSGNPLPLCPSTDQRGYSRSADAQCSVGAYEFFPATKLSLNNPGSFTYGAPQAMSATLALADPSLTTGQSPLSCGTITFTATPTGGSPITLGSGDITPGALTVSITPAQTALPVGSYTLAASYTGDGGCIPTSGASRGSYAASTTTSALTVTNAPTTTTLTASTSSASAGQHVTLTATVDPVVTPTAGTVTFYNGSTALGTVSLNGSNVATFTTPALGAGTFHFSASYGGTTNFAASGASSTVTVKVAPGSGRSGNGSTSSPQTAQSPATSGQSGTANAGHTSNGSQPKATAGVGVAQLDGFPLWLAGLLALLAFALLGGGALLVGRARQARGR